MSFPQLVISLMTPPTVYLVIAAAFLVAERLALIIILAGRKKHQVAERQFTTMVTLKAMGQAKTLELQAVFIHELESQLMLTEFQLECEMAENEELHVELERVRERRDMLEDVLMEQIREKEARG